MVGRMLVDHLPLAILVVGLISGIILYFFPATPFPLCNLLVVLASVGPLEAIALWAQSE